MTIDTANIYSLQEPLLSAATDAPSTTDEESPIEAVRILVDAEDVTERDGTLAATVATTSTINTTTNNNGIAGGCGEGNNNNTEDTDDEQPQTPRCYYKDFAFVLACLATIVTAGFLVGSIFLICDIIGSDPDGGENIALLFLIICVCFMFLYVYGIIRIWRAYYRDCDYKFVDCGSIYTMSSAIGFILVGPLGGLLGAGVAAILWCIISHCSPCRTSIPPN